MNGEIFHPLRNRGGTFNLNPGFLLRNAAAVLGALLIAMYGCAPEHSLERAAVRPVLAEPEPLPSPVPFPSPSPSVVETETNKNTQSQVQISEGDEEPRWAEGYEGLLIAGLDGGLYEPYGYATIERAQRALSERGLYAGPVNGALGTLTMKALYEFQRATHTLQLCGIPTPRTRKMLEQGSHTDPVL